MKKPKRKLTAAERRARRERKMKFMTIFINGKQKQVPRPQLIEGLSVDEFLARNADPIWLHQNGMWEFMTDTLEHIDYPEDMDYTESTEEFDGKSVPF